jgi:putative ubiquitin-RnfH superfamily antitoxin RatB of RatAB toxin-antitoxin module
MARADAPPVPAGLRIEIVFSPRAGEVTHVELTVADGSTLGDALRLSAFAVPAGADIGLWGRLLDPRTALATPLRDRDRIEFHRPLAVDPKEARRRRAQVQRAAAASAAEARG